MVSKGPKQERSPQRSPARSYRKSPSRAVKSKSPSRVTTNSPLASPKPRRSIRQSPSRTTASSPKRSPSRRSPARTTPGRIDKSKSNVPDRITRASSKSRQEIESETDDDLPLTVRAELKTRGRTKITTAEAKESQNIIPKLREATPEVGSYINLIRRSTTKSFIHEMDHIDHLKRESSTSSIRKLTELSDEDDVVTEDFREKSVRKSEPKVIDKMTPNEFGSINAFLYILSIPLGPLTFLAYCNDKQCNFTMSPKFNHSFSTYFGMKPFAIVLCHLFLVFIISALPFGGPKVSGLPIRGKKLNYVMNGLFTLVVVGVVLILLETFTGALVIDTVLQNPFQYAVSSAVVGVILSLTLYVQSFYVPLCGLKSDAPINNAIYNFYHGREINPRLFGVIDVKLSLLRFYYISLIILNAALIYKSVTFKILTDGDIDYNSIKCNEPLTVYAAMQIIHLTCCLIFESDIFVTSFLAQYEAVGYEFVVTVMVGLMFMFTPSKYLFDYGVALPRWHLILTAILFMAGLVVFHRSNAQKRQFRVNPYHPKLSHLETLPTSQGRKLLVSGYWGMVRHPNYLGHLMMITALLLLVYNAIPALVLISDIFWCFGRVHQTELKCKQRYGSAWKRYCQRVKHCLIPKVY